MMYKYENGKKVKMTAIEEQSIIDERAIEAPKLTEESRVKSIKAEAQRRIIKLKPNWTRKNHKTKQRNLLMRGNILLLNLIKAIQTGVQADIDTAMAKAEQAASIVPKIRKIRKMSNLAETNGDSLAKFKTDIKAAGL